MITWEGHLFNTERSKVMNPKASSITSSLKEESGIHNNYEYFFFIWKPVNMSEKQTF